MPQATPPSAPESDGIEGACHVRWRWSVFERDRQYGTLHEVQGSSGGPSPLQDLFPNIIPFSTGQGGEATDSGGVLVCARSRLVTAVL